MKRRSLLFWALVILLATSPYTVGYLIPAALATHHQAVRFMAAKAQSDAEGAHADAVACGNLPAADVGTTTPASDATESSAP